MKKYKSGNGYGNYFGFTTGITSIYDGDGFSYDFDADKYFGLEKRIYPHEIMTGKKIKDKEKEYKNETT